MALDSASYQAFWDIYDATGIRPEYLVPVLAYESGLDPSIPNREGYPYYGINQISGGFLASLGIAPDDYLTWPASRQLREVVLPYFRGNVKRYGPLHSGIRVYQAEYYPASLDYAHGLDDVIVAAPSEAYKANRTFDKQGKGYITPRDLGDAIAGQLKHSYVQHAIASTYALRPGESPEDPVYGTDFGLGTWKALAIGAAVVAGAGALAWWLGQPKTRRMLRRAIA